MPFVLLEKNDEEDCVNFDGELLMFTFVRIKIYEQLKNYYFFFKL
jgi:hypothetical protein